MAVACFQPKVATQWFFGLLTRKHMSEACKDLGIFLAPDGNMKAQFTSSLHNSKRLKMIMSSSPLTRSEAIVFYHSRCMGWARYFLPITTFSNKQCNKIQSQIHQALLPKVGYNCHMLLTVVFGLRMCGIGLGLYRAPSEPTK
jgi:hypothetical protein